MYIPQAKITMNHADGTFWHSDNDWNAPRSWALQSTCVDLPGGERQRQTGLIAACPLTPPWVGPYLVGPTNTKGWVPGVTNEADVPVHDTLPLVTQQVSGRPPPRVVLTTGHGGTCNREGLGRDRQLVGDCGRRVLGNE